jgi:hypothetical protein
LLYSPLSLFLSLSQKSEDYQSCYYIKITDFLSSASFCFSRRSALRVASYYISRFLLLGLPDTYTHTYKLTHCFSFVVAGVSSSPLPSAGVRATCVSTALFIYIIL